MTNVFGEIKHLYRNRGVVECYLMALGVLRSHGKQQLLSMLWKASAPWQGQIVQPVHRYYKSRVLRDPVFVWLWSFG
jgi:hypothetical protein